MFKMSTMRNGIVALAVASAGLSAPLRASAEEVYVLRGAFDVFSAGMNQMTKRMQARGINAKAYSNGRWSGLADDIIKRHKRGAVSHPIVIMGHSVGGQEAAKMSNKLGQAGVSVKLVVGFDPGFARPVPFRYGSPRVVNFYIANQPRGHPYRSASGFGGSINNVNIKTFTNADHVQIDKDPKVQSKALSAVYSAVGK